MRKICVLLVFAVVLCGCEKKVSIPDVEEIEKITYHGHWETSDINKIQDLLGYMESVKRGWKEAEETLPHTERIISIEMPGGVFKRVFFYEDSVVFRHRTRDLTSSDKVRLEALFHRLEE